MSLKQTYQEYILEKLHKEYLEQGIVPTSDTLEADLEEYQETHPNLEEPSSKALDFSVERGSSSSASHIYTIAQSVSDDVGVITREIYRLVRVNSTFYDRWILEMKRLGSLARKLEDRVDSLLLLGQQTAGYFAHVSDVFTDMNKVDTDNTTAKIDLAEATVSLNPAFVDQAALGSQIDLTHMTENDVSFRPLSRRPGLSYFTTNQNNSLSQIFKTENSRWVGKVAVTTPGEMVCELKARVSKNTNLEVSKIFFGYTGPDNTGRSTVTCQYSLDGYNWFLVPTDEATKTLTPKVTWFFPLTELRWIKLIFRKPTHDAGEYEYIFAGDYLKLFGSSYNVSVGNTLISNSLSAIDVEDNPVAFSSVALNVCEEIQTNTDIKYYISASKDESTWTNWTTIAPSDRIGLGDPKVINLGGIDWSNNQGEEDDTVKLDTSLSGVISNMQIATSFSNSSLTSLTGYRFANGAFGAVNTGILPTASDSVNFVAKSIVAWRNVRNKNKFDYPATYPDTALVRGIARGWGLEGNVYSCYFEVVNSKGITVDFGHTTCAIDDSYVSGIVNISQGIHKFTTNVDNWFDISTNLTNFGNTVESEETLKVLDPLYPYNHKLIIEGFPYVADFAGEKLYKGMDISAEFYATRVSLFDLENNIDDYSYFAVRNVGDATTPVLAVVVKYDATNTDYSNELFAIKWRGGGSSSLFKYIKLKAVLQSSDSSRTPILSSYRLLLGV